MHVSMETQRSREAEGHVKFVFFSCYGSRTRDSAFMPLGQDFFKNKIIVIKDYQC